MNRNWKLLMLLAAVTATAALSACGGKTATNTSDLVTENLRDVTYRMEELCDLPTADGSGYDSMERIGDRLYAFRYVWGASGDGCMQLSMALDGSDQKEREVPGGEGSSSGSVTCDGAGNLFILREYSEPIDAENGAGIYMERYDATDALQWRVPLTEEDRAASYISDLIVLEDGRLLTASHKGFSLYDGTTGKGRFLFRPQGMAEYMSPTVLKAADGKYYSLITNQEGTQIELLELDIDGGKVASTTPMPAGFNGTLLYTGTEHLFLYPDGDKLLWWQPGQATMQTLCDFTGSGLDMNGGSISTVVELNDQQFLALYYESGRNQPSLARCTKVDPSEYKERKTVVMSCVYIWDELRRNIAQFNRTNTDYVIQIRDYSKVQGNEGKEYNQLLESMNMDIAAGNIPDLIVLRSEQPATSYINKGLFADLKPFFDKDPDISVDDLMPNVLEAYTTNGKLYQLAPRFSIATCMMGADTISDGPVTLMNYKEVCERNGVAVEDIFGSIQRSWGMTELIKYCGDGFIDWDKGTCSYDSEAFTNLLELVKALPNPGPNDTVDYNKYDTYYREHKSLLLRQNYGDCSNYMSGKKGHFGREIVFNGYPGVDGGVSVIDPSYLISISDKSKNKEAAWAYIKQLLTMDAQYESSENGIHYYYGFPLRKEAFQKVMADAQEMQYDVDETTGEKTPRTQFWWIAGQEVEIPPMNAQEAQQFEEFVDSVRSPVHNDDKVFKIIEEETAAYFEGQKSAKEVAGIIQSRVSIYLSEIR